MYAMVDKLFNILNMIKEQATINYNNVVNLCNLTCIILSMFIFFQCLCLAVITLRIDIELHELQTNRLLRMEDNSTST